MGQGKAELDHQDASSRIGARTPDQERVRALEAENAQLRETLNALTGGADLARLLQAEAALRKAEEQRSMATEAAGIGLWDYDPATGVLYGDERCCALLYTTPEKFTLETAVARMHPEDRERALEQNRRRTAQDTGEAYQNEYRLIDPVTKEERWILSRGRVWFEDGKAVRMAGANMDITERKQAEQNQVLLMHELNHRVKNTLANVQAVASRTLRSAADLDQARMALTARLVALAKAHDILTAENWEGAELADVAHSALTPYRETGGDRFDISGPFVRISPAKALALFMALNELTTNAMKYGALSTEAGRVALRWAVEHDGETRRLKLFWAESGGPTVVPPSHTGFGSRLLQQGLSGQLGAHVEMDYRPEGLRCAIDAPLLHVDRKTPR